LSPWGPGAGGRGVRVAEKGEEDGAEPGPRKRGPGLHGVNTMRRNIGPRSGPPVRGNGGPSWFSAKGPMFCFFARTVKMGGPRLPEAVLLVLIFYARTPGGSRTSCNNGGMPGFFLDRSSRGPAKTGGMWFERGKKARSARGPDRGPDITNRSARSAREGGKAPPTTGAGSRRSRRMGRPRIWIERWLFGKAAWAGSPGGPVCGRSGPRLGRGGTPDRETTGGSVGAIDRGARNRGRKQSRRRPFRSEGARSCLVAGGRVGGGEPRGGRVYRCKKNKTGVRRRGSPPCNVFAQAAARLGGRVALPRPIGCLDGWTPGPIGVGRGSLQWRVGLKAGRGPPVKAETTWGVKRPVVVLLGGDSGPGYGGGRRRANPEPGSGTSRAVSGAGARPGG